MSGRGRDRIHSYWCAYPEHRGKTLIKIYSVRTGKLIQSHVIPRGHSFAAEPGCIPFSKWKQIYSARKRNSAAQEKAYTLTEAAAMGKAFLEPGEQVIKPGPLSKLDMQIESVCSLAR